MTSKELIEKLKKLDPEGIVDVCVDNEPIYFIERLPAYYDGRLGRLIEDPTLKGKAYSIIGYEVTSAGDKIILKTVGLGDCMIDNPDIPVKIHDEKYLDSRGLEHTRAAYRKVLTEIQEDHLTSYILSGKKDSIKRIMEELDIAESKATIKYRLKWVFKYWFLQTLKGFPRAMRFLFMSN